MKSTRECLTKLVGIVAGGFLFVSPAAAGGAERAVDPLVNQVWMQSAADRPGVIRVFLANGTLLVDSCWETFRLERWHRDGDGVVWSEDTVEIRADVISLDEDELVLDLQLRGGAERQEFRAATVPYLCPDMPKGVSLGAAPSLTYGCDDPEGEPFVFSVRFLDEAAELGLPPRFERPGLIVVPQVRAASGSKYEGGSVLFWVAGERVRLDVDGVSFGPCAEHPLEPQAVDPWQLARSERVAFRALGQEPFWKLDVVPGRWMRFELVGVEPVTTPVPEAESANGSTFYNAVTEGHELMVEIDPTTCHDSMSGHEFEATVTVTVDGAVYHGCGRVP